jgi:hypothetical protein
VKKELSFSYSPLPLIGLNGTNFAIKETFNKSLELLELLENFGFVFEEIYPYKFAEIIDKTHIIFKPAN